MATAAGPRRAADRAADRRTDRGPCPGPVPRGLQRLPSGRAPGRARRHRPRSGDGPSDPAFGRARQSPSTSSATSSQPAGTDAPGGPACATAAGTDRRGPRPPPCRPWSARSTTRPGPSRPPPSPAIRRMRAGYLELLRTIVRRKGIPVAVYRDRHGIFEPVIEPTRGRQPGRRSRSVAQPGRSRAGRARDRIDPGGVTPGEGPDRAAVGRLDVLARRRSCAWRAPTIERPPTGSWPPICRASIVASGSRPPTRQPPWVPARPRDLPPRPRVLLQVPSSGGLRSHRPDGRPGPPAAARSGSRGVCRSPGRGPTFGSMAGSSLFDGERQSSSLSPAYHLRCHCLAHPPRSSHGARLDARTSRLRSPAAAAVIIRGGRWPSARPPRNEH